MEKIIKETIADILEAMDIGYDKINVEQSEENFYRANIESEEYSPLLIGFHGETVAALQHIVKILVWKKAKLEDGSNFTIDLDIDDYKARQEEAALSIARRKVDEAISEERTIELPAMRPYLRKKVHMYIAELQNPNLSTESVGEGDDRKIKIIYNK